MAAVHCKAGKGRTGLVVVCYLMYSGLRPDAATARAYYDRERTKDSKGLTIISQARLALPTCRRRGTLAQFPSDKDSRRALLQCPAPSFDTQACPCRIRGMLAGLWLPAAVLPQAPRKPPEPATSFTENKGREAEGTEAARDVGAAGSAPCPIQTCILGPDRAAPSGGRLPSRTRSRDTAAHLEPPPPMTAESVLTTTPAAARRRHAQSGPRRPPASPHQPPHPVRPAACGPADPLCPLLRAPPPHPPGPPPRLRPAPAAPAPGPRPRRPPARSPPPPAAAPRRPRRARPQCGGGGRLRARPRRAPHIPGQRRATRPCRGRVPGGRPGYGGEPARGPAA